MKTINLHTRSGKRILLCMALPLLLSGCYTVLKQSGGYYSEFDQNSAAKDTALQISDDDSALAGNESEPADNNDPGNGEENDDQTIVNNYYGSAWNGYYHPYGRWSLSIGYGNYPYLGGWYDWGYPSWDYYYWGGCYYPTIYTGYYRPYYPYYHTNLSPVYSYSRRNYGGRHYVNQVGLAGGTRASTAGRVSSGQRQYKTASSTSGKKTGKAAVRNGRRQYRSGNNVSGPTKKSRGASRTARKASNRDQSVKRGLENAARSQSGSGTATQGSSGGGSASRGSSNSGGGSRATAPRSSGGGRSYRK